MSIDDWIRHPVIGSLQRSYQQWPPLSRVKVCFKLPRGWDRVGKWTQHPGHIVLRHCPTGSEPLWAKILHVHDLQALQYVLDDSHCRQNQACPTVVLCLPQQNLTNEGGLRISMESMGSFLCFPLGTVH